MREIFGILAQSEAKKQTDLKLTLDDVRNRLRANESPESILKAIENV